MPINFDQHYIDIFQFLIYTVKAVPKAQLLPLKTIVFRTKIISISIPTSLDVYDNYINLYNSLS